MCHQIQLFTWVLGIQIQVAVFTEQEFLGLSSLFPFEAGSHAVQAGLQLAMQLRLGLKGWDFKQALSSLAFMVLEMEPTALRLLGKH